MKADDAPAHAMSQIQWRQKRFALDFTPLFFTQLTAHDFSRMKFVLKKADFYSSVFFFTQRCLQKSFKNVITLFLSLVDSLLINIALSVIIIRARKRERESKTMASSSLSSRALVSHREQQRGLASLLSRKKRIRRKHVFNGSRSSSNTVSYTHLPLPTNREV